MALGIGDLRSVRNILADFRRDPLLSRYLVSTLGTSLTLNIDKARRLLNYKPVQTSEQGLGEYLHDLKKCTNHG